MVACFRYASIDVHSVYLPPAKIEFNYDNQDWIKKEANEVRLMDILFLYYFFMIDDLIIINIPLFCLIGS